MEVGADLVRPDASDINAVMSASFTSSAYIQLDGQPYVMASNPDYIVQIQDTRGLANLNFLASANLRRLLAYYGAPEELRNQLPDTLADWKDEDDLTRLSGAEKPDYQRRNRLPPTNSPLLTPMEVQSVLGWDQVPQMWEADLRSPLLTSCGISGFNPNTAPEASLLAHVPGMTPAVAAQVIAERKQTPLRSARDLMARAGVLIPNEAFFFSMTAGQCFIVEVANRNSSERVRFALSLVPTSQNQPWQVDYVLNIPSQYRQKLEGIDPQVTFPAPEAIYPVEPGRQRESGV
jgi:hypothetical protein